MQQRRRLTITWEEVEVRFYDQLKEKVTEAGQSMSDYEKNILKSK
jgi:hypothetical protein